MRAAAAATPLVTCIMPTRNRRRFVSQSIWYFLRQQYPARELVVVDDGEDAIRDLLPNDDRIRYVRPDGRLPLEAKRELACELARGELIAHWDDDDWIAPQRLSAQVNQLLSTDADVCGLGDVLHYRLDQGDAWLFRSESSAPPIGTLLYRRSAWDKHRSPENLLAHVPKSRQRVVSDASFYVAVLHAGNSSPRNLRDPAWERRRVEEVTDRFAGDRDFYVGLRQDGAANGHANKPSADSITVAAPFMVYDGYGSVAEYLALGMARAGATVNIHPFRLDRAGTSAEFQELLDRSQPDPSSTTLCFCWPRENFAPFGRARDLFISTMWETSRLPGGWADLLNAARAVIVPSRFVARVFRESGVAVPVEVVPQGVDPAIYHYQARPARQGLTTLIVGTLVPRKNVDEGIAAWQQAFAGDRAAKLIVKTRFKLRALTLDDPRIAVVDTEEPSRGIAHWYRTADVLLALGNEGFGLPLVEGMACGLPVIALASEGQADVCDAAPHCTLPVRPSRWATFDEQPFGACGVRGIPAVEDVANKLRWVDTHRDEARALGRAASDWVLRHRNIWTYGPASLEVMERHLSSRRPLRQMYTLWGPGIRPAQVVEYTRELAAALPSVRVVNCAPDMPGNRLVHIQHHATLADDADLANYVQRARYAGLPVVVTSHDAAESARAWERDATLLVGTTPDDVERLRARWPGKRVEYLPLGCPTWFPVRKRQRGRVVTVLGAPGEAARAAEAIRGIPRIQVRVCTIRAHTPKAAIARELAAEADVLVVCGGGGVPASQSDLRLALATGVPVVSAAGIAPIDAELALAVLRVDDLATAVGPVLEDTALRRRLVAAARDYCHAHSWERLAARHLALWRTLEHT